MKQFKADPEAEMARQAITTKRQQANWVQWLKDKAEATRKLYAEVIVEGEDPDIRRWKEDPFLLRGM